METIITKATRSGYKPPDFIDREKYREVFENLQQSLSRWGESHEDEQYADPQTVYYLSESAVRAMLDKPAEENVSLGEKVLLTVEEAAAYTGIGVKKIREMTDSENCPYVVWNGTKRLIKRKMFTAYLEKCYSI